MARVKKADKDRSQSSRELSDHIVQSGQVVDEQSIEGESNVQYDVQQGEVHSDVRLEDDKGTGKAVVLRHFDYKANPAAFKAHTPSKQELFNAHKNQIYAFLLDDQMKPFEEVSPRVILSKRKDGYRIIVAALPFGMNRTNIPTLSEIANGHS